MPSLHRATLLLATGLVASGMTLVQSALAAAQPPTPDRTRVIVELEGEGALAAAPGPARAARASDVKAERSKLAVKQTEFVAKAEESGVASSRVQRFNLLLNAVTMTVDTADLARLRSLPGVETVTPEGTMRALTTDANAVVGNPDLWQRQDALGDRVTGKGVTVAVIDTGVDYTHPDLGGGFGEGHKVVGGYDFVNGDADPMDDQGHGTHVAGIVASKAATDGGVTGAAPDADLLAYKVLGANGSGGDSGIIAALEAAVDPANPHRADIINMSLGDQAGNGDDPVSRAATAAVDAGVLVFAAAGNAGPGYFTVGSPAAAPGVIAVGASTSGVRLPVLELVGGDEPLQTYRGARSANPPSQSVTAGLVDIGWGTPDDWAAAGDVTGKIVLFVIPPSQANPYDVWEEELAVWREAERRGAVAVVGGTGGGGGPVGPVSLGNRTRINPLAGDPVLRPDAQQAGEALVGAHGTAFPAESGDSLRMDRLVVMGIDPVEGQQLVALAGAGAQVTLSGRDSSDEMASFSSRGPDPELDLKPEIVAPGVEIRSTAPLGMVADGVLHMSGTSMATPMAAGSAALLRQLHPDSTAAELGARMVGTAKTLDGPDLQAQGSGRLDTVAAADTDLVASPATVSFRLPHMDGPQVTGTRTITVRNTSDQPVSGQVSVTGPASVTPGHVAIPPGGTAELTLTVLRDRPDVTDYATNYLGGRVTVTPDSGRRISVPYLMTAIPLYVDAAVDPTVDGNTTVYVYSPTRLTAAPRLTVQPPKGRPVTVDTVATSNPFYYSAELRGLADGVHTMSARATTADGMRQLGTGAFEVAKAPSNSNRWKAIGPNSAVGSTHLAAGAPRQAVMTQGTRTGAWLTTDNGRTWEQRANTPVRNALLEPSLVIDADNPARWWEAVASTHPSAFPSGGALLRTEDSGRTWERMDAPPVPWTDLQADPQTRVLLASSGYTGEYFASRDKGESWTAVDFQALGVTASFIGDVRIGGDDLYVWAGRRISVIRGYVTGNPQPIATVYDGATNGTFLFGFDVDPDLVALNAVGQNSGLYVSRDGGRTMEKTTRRYNGLIDVQGGDIYHDDLTGTGGISRDGGRTWTEVEQPVQSSVVYDYDRWADGSWTIGSGSAGLFRSTAEGGYRRIGVQGESVPALAVAGESLLAGTSVGTYRTQVPAASPEWGAAENEGTVGTSVAAFHVSETDPNVVWRAKNNLFGSNIEKSTDAGASWSEIGQLDGTAKALMVDPENPDRIVVSFQHPAGSGVHTTVDGGTHWKKRTHYKYYDAVTADPTHPGRIWLGGLWGLAYSDDLGATSTQVSEAEVHAIEFRGSAMVVGGTAIRVSTDGGATFRKADTGALRLMVSDFVEVDGTLYAGTTTRWMDFTPNGGRGVLRSTDGGLTWKNISRGMPNLDVLSLAASSDGRYLFAGVDQGGVHRLELDD